MRKSTTRISVLIAATVSMVTLVTSQTAGATDTVHSSNGHAIRLNHVQVVGTHNSYHVEVSPKEKAIRSSLSPATEPALEYTFTTPVKWDAAQMDTLDREIKSVFRPSDVITPDDVRGGYPTLESAVLGRGWPTLAASRGKVMFLMDNAGDHRTTYLAGHPSLRGRQLFTNSTPGQPDAAFVEENDPTASNFARIQDEVRRGYIVRTRADVDTVQARTGDTSMRDAAFSSGAQMVSTDYPVPGISSRFGTNYVAQLPGGAVVRCNPVNAPSRCSDTRLTGG